MEVLYLQTRLKQVWHHLFLAVLYSTLGTVFIVILQVRTQWPLVNMVVVVARVHFVLYSRTVLHECIQDPSGDWPAGTEYILYSRTQWYCPSPHQQDGQKHRVQIERPTVLNLINLAHGHSLCYWIHYIEQKDWTAGLDAGGLWEIPFTKVNQVYSSYTGQTVHKRAALYPYSMARRSPSTDVLNDPTWWMACWASWKRSMIGTGRRPHSLSKSPCDGQNRFGCLHT